MHEPRARAQLASPDSEMICRFLVRSYGWKGLEKNIPKKESGIKTKSRDLEQSSKASKRSRYDMLLQVLTCLTSVSSFTQNGWNARRYTVWSMLLPVHMMSSHAEFAIAVYVSVYV